MVHTLQVDGLARITGLSGSYSLTHPRDDVKLAQLVRARDCPEVVGSILTKTQNPENSNLHGFEVHRPSSKGTQLLFQVIKAVVNQSATKRRPPIPCMTYWYWTGGGVKP